MNANKTGTDIFIAGEYLAPIVTIILLTALYCKKKIKKAYILFWIGFLIASIWEWAHWAIQNPKFITVDPYIEKYIPGSVYNVLHSLHDAMLFVIGYFLCYLVFKKRAFRGCNIIFSFLIQFVFFVGIEIVVEILFNGRVWTYTTDGRNPAIIRFNATGREHIVNLWPVLEWVFASFVFTVFEICI